jgi:hypothetical protein
MDLREEIAKAVYELDPYCEGGEYVDGFQVSPGGGELSWEQAKAQDAEFAGDGILLPLTELPYEVADAVVIKIQPRWVDKFFYFIGGAAFGTLVQIAIIWKWGWS